MRQIQETFQEKKKTSNAAIKEGPQTYSMTTKNVAIRSDPESLSKSRTCFVWDLWGQKRQGLIYCWTCPRGIYTTTRPRVWPWLLDAASPISCHSSRPEVWEDRSTLTQFSRFSAQLWRRTCESLLLCDFEKASCVLNFPHRWLCVERQLLLPQMEEAGGGETAEVELFLPFFRTRKRFHQLRFQHVRQCHLDTQHHLFVYSVWVHVCCVSDVLVFDALPALSFVYSWGRGISNKKIPQTKQSDGIRGTRKYKSLTLSWADLFADHFHQ